MFVGFSVALIQSLYWDPHHLLDPHQYMGPSVRLLGPQYGMALSRIWGPRCLRGRSICGAFSILWLLVGVEPSVCRRTMDLCNIFLACGARYLWICRTFGMTWLLVVVRDRGPGDLDGPGASPLSFVWGDVFIGTQTYLPPKVSFSSDFGHFILKMVEKTKLSYVSRKKTLKYH